MSDRVDFLLDFVLVFDHPSHLAFTLFKLCSEETCLLSYLFDYVLLDGR